MAKFIKTKDGTAFINLEQVGAVFCDPDNGDKASIMIGGHAIECDIPFDEVVKKIERAYGIEPKKGCPQDCIHVRNKAANYPCSHCNRRYSDKYEREDRK